MFRPKFRHPDGLNSPVRRVITGLAEEIPIEHCCLITLRFILFTLLFIFGFTYASFQPKVYHDVLTWPNNASLPYKVYVYRNTTLSLGRIGWGINPNRSDITLSGSFLWNETSPPGCEPYNCNDTRLINPEIECDGGWLQSSRIGFEDSLGFRMDDEKPGMFYIDRYVFWMVIVFGGVAVGHCLACLCHTVQPEGIAFYQYEVIMDSILALAFLSLGVFPLAWLPNGNLGGTEGFPERWNYSMSDQQLKNRHDLGTSTAMGWTCFIFFTALVVLNILLINNLNLFKKIATTTPGNAARNALVENIPGFGPINITSSYRIEHSSFRRRSSGGNAV